MLSFDHCRGLGATLGLLGREALAAFESTCEVWKWWEVWSHVLWPHVPARKCKSNICMSVMLCWGTWAGQSMLAEAQVRDR
jgi:hypothetical protein